jgi:hypothetical protein
VGEVVVRGYMVSVRYRNANLDLHLNATAADLNRLLQGLDATPEVVSLTVHSTLTVPQLHKLSKLTRADLGLEDKALEKIQ